MGPEPCILDFLYNGHLQAYMKSLTQLLGFATAGLKVFRVPGFVETAIRSLKVELLIISRRGSRSEVSQGWTATFATSLH